MANQSMLLTTPEPSLQVTRIGGSLQVEAWAKPELEVNGDPADLGRDEQTITISCGGDLAIKVPPGAVLRVDFVGRDLEVRGLNGSVEISFVGRDLTLRDLQGQVTFHGMVGGRTRLENVTRVATSGHGPGPFGSGEAGPWPQADRIAQRAEEQRRRIEKKVLSAERKLKRIRMGIAGTGASWKWGGMPGANEASEAQPAVSDEERVAILKMLQEKKISAEEAERLLAALEGES